MSPSSRSTRAMSQRRGCTITDPTSSAKSSSCGRVQGRCTFQTRPERAPGSFLIQINIGRGFAHILVSCQKAPHILAFRELCMPHKQILFHSAAREKVLRGASLLADAVRVTLGPKSKSVLIQKSWGAPIVCNDGVTIAKEFDLKDPEENLGAQVLRQAAEKTGDAVGDGTSTSTILAQTIFADGVRNVVAGASAVDIKKGLERGVKVAIDALRAMARPVQTRKEKAQVASISAHNDAAIGDLVADA